MANLVELFDNIVQMQNLNGVPLANGKLYVYALGRTRLMDTWSDVDGESLNTNPIILDDAGQAHCFVSDDFDYTLVVKDAYDNEIFSIDKYLYSKGEHSHADVAVAPSEHIGVSSYHVGETTVYVPYITGELGKTYHGIEPIVVNNQVNKISARNIPLGVQEPLYFAEDSESACIIGASGLAYQSGVDYVSGVVDTKYDTTAAESALATKVNSADFTAYQEEVTQAFQNVSDDVNFLSGAIDDVVSGAHADIDFLSGKVDTKLDTTAFSTASGNFITAHQSLSAYATTADVNDLAESISETYQPKGDYATHDDLSGFMESSKLETAGGKITGYDGTAFAGGGSVDPSEFIPWSASGEFQSAGNYATTEDLTAYQPVGNYYSASNPDGFINSDAISAMATTGFVADVSADITAMIPTALTGDYLDKASADTLYYPLNSNPNNYLTELPADVAYTGWVENSIVSATSGLQPSGNYLTTGDLTGKQDITGMTAYATVESLTAKQDAGDYLSASDSANFLLTSDSGNFYPMNENPAGYLTAHQDLSDYQTTAGMTAYQPIGDYVQGSDLSLNSYDKISAISGHELAGGGSSVDFDYDPDGNISGINNSAISDSRAGTPLYVESPLFTGQSGESAYIGSDINETVLWSGDSTGSAYVFDLSGNISDYKYIEMYAVDVDGWGGYTKMPSEYFTTANRIPVVTQHYGTQTKNIIMRGMYVHPTSDTRLDSISFGFDYAGTANPNSNMSMKRIVGINRKRV